MSRSEISIRSAIAGDRPVVAQLYRDWEGEAITPGLRADAEEDLAAKLHGWFLFACDAGQVVGFATGEARALGAGEWIVCPAGDRYLRVEDVYVVPALRGQGIGSALMKRLMDTAKADHVDYVAVYSSSQPWSRVISFYESLGLRIWFVQMFGEIPGDAT